ncbi:hypothetical protein [Arthrobacter sp. L77]|uniref:hypothetical protein n=1 Tax=Arthrobacter sp. L77 TaxID=1496689 RepID=UPI0012DFFC5E|nr:hypothetical protein [Arthrobacter sp. L77]
MDGGMHGGASGEAWAVVSTEVAAMAARLRWHAGQMADIRRHALSVGLLSWESPAGGNFRDYLAERGRELGSTAELLESAAHELGVFARLVRDAEDQQRGAGL